MWVFSGLLGLPILAAPSFRKDNKMRRNSFHRLKSLLISLAITLSFAISLSSFGISEDVTRQRLDYASAIQLVPVMANNPGQFGSFFKTRVSILNVAPLNYSIKATLYNQNGKVNEVTIPIANGQQQNYENFLQEVFAYQGAGTVELDAWFGILGGSSDNKFLLNVEVYTESPSGRYKTIVIPADNISSSFPAFSPGIYVDANSRTNIGCFNDGFGTNLIQADLHSPAGTLINTYQMDLGEDSWNQIGLGDPVSGGYIRWRPTSSCFCYSVVVDNTSNDGSFIPATIYIQ
jgi:hypothetical protein